MIKLKINEKPILKHCEMNCDKPLHKKLDEYDLTKFLNKHSTSVFIGRPGSGKSSILNSLFSSLFTKVFHKIYLFIPDNSKASVKKSPFDVVPEEQQYNELTLENLNAVITEIKSADKKNNNIIILDDMASYLKNAETLKLLRELMMNKRHLHTSVIFLSQSWKLIDKTMRKLFDNLFIFKVSKEELLTIAEEVIEVPKEQLLKISKMVNTEPYKYIFYNSISNRIFDGFDEFILGEDD
jgi:DNA repair exonuclease SbcCD ATPase subunit